jgi:DNA invertase Pin-like site-specific DNA recombinase
VQTNAAAQYIRMSTDKQDLSLRIQKDAIATYASTHGLEVTTSYDDEGRSGLYLRNRLGLSRLLRDVANGPPTASSWFTT